MREVLESTYTGDFKGADFIYDIVENSDYSESAWREGGGANAQNLEKFHIGCQNDGFKVSDFVMNKILIP